ncbi:NrfD/PsrC family molybdoenzyme membrane anchor subunit [Caldinitratiruptor microaerophilus]|uniref:Molybdopterin oxidoreductase n=1 Tax=Caldinitratiruptor microaerophilus TaxID=671077 RepID=A0AA35GA99_9FIRM|nr:NrfD/PsrC family molybdoenzyme membrane anchor subunit [Caldinitratiruptor microaerophilus]BDG61069.1 hypothetical protein caldi_21590 [Caldinitratiruptor microaerophilus]
MATTVSSGSPARRVAGRPSAAPGVSPALRTGWYTVLGIVILAGVWAFAQRLAGGLRVTHLTSVTPWGAWVAFYIYFVGLSAGAFLLSSLVYVFGLERYERIGRAALLMAIVSMGVALGFVAIDLGRLDRAFYPLVFFNWTSPLAWEVRFYVLYILLLSAELALAIRLHRAGPDAPPHLRRWLRVLGTLGIPIAIFGVHGGTGTIFAVVKARGMWFGGLFPVIFVASALVSGTALLTLIDYVHARVSGRQPDEGLMRGLGGLLAGFLLVDLGLEFYEFLVPLLGFAPHDTEIIRLMATGPMAWAFWWVQVVPGSLVPAAILLTPALRGSPAWVAIASGLVVVGIAAVRFHIVVPPLIPPVMAGLPEGHYLPSANEWLLSAGLIAAGLLGYSVAAEVLPIHDEAREYQGEEVPA